MRILICGGRKLNSDHVATYLETLLEHMTDMFIIHGGAHGGDEGADKFAKKFGISTAIYLADWKQHGNAAGPIRNKKMLLEGKPDLIIAFPGGSGTDNMIHEAALRYCPIITIPEGWDKALIEKELPRYVEINW